MRKYCAGPNDKKSRDTYRCHSRFGMIDIHPAVEELRTSEVPVRPCKSVTVMEQVSMETSGDFKALKRTNLIATGVLVRTLTPE